MTDATGQMSLAIHALWFGAMPAVGYVSGRYAGAVADALVPGGDAGVTRVTPRALALALALAGGAGAIGILWAGVRPSWLVAHSIFVVASMLLVGTDIARRVLPDALTYPLIAAGIVAAAVGATGLPVRVALTGAVVCYLPLAVASALTTRFSSISGIGIGDAALAAAMGAWFGPLPALYLVGLGMVAAAVAIAARRGRPVPFAPFLYASLAACLAWPVVWPA